MTSDIDIYRSANELIKQFGDAADIEAAMRADERLAAGDMDGAVASWTGRSGRRTSSWETNGRDKSLKTDAR